MKIINQMKIFIFSDHHLSHAASAFFPSPFEQAVVLTADGVGEWATTTVAVGKENTLDDKKRNTISTFFRIIVFSIYILRWIQRLIVENINLWV